MAVKRLPKLDLGLAPKLTLMEKKFLNAMRNNEYNDGLEGGAVWNFTAIDNSGIDIHSVGGVMSSLVKKELIGVRNVTANERNRGDEDNCWFTDKGKALFDNADGEECDWGGKPLLKI